MHTLLDIIVKLGSDVKISLGLKKLSFNNNFKDNVKIFFILLDVSNGHGYVHLDTYKIRTLLIQI